MKFPENYSEKQPDQLASVLEAAEKKAAAIERINSIALAMLKAGLWWVAGFISCWFLFQWVTS